jgi:hypothetical protein
MSAMDWRDSMPPSFYAPAHDRALRTQYEPEPPEPFDLWPFEWRGEMQCLDWRDP